MPFSATSPHAGTVLFLGAGASASFGYPVTPGIFAAIWACIRESDGKVLSRYLSPRRGDGTKHDWPEQSLSGSPLAEGTSCGSAPIATKSCASTSVR